MQQRTEKLWREEKYRVMFHSQKHYNLIRQAMRQELPYADIKQLIADALLQTPTVGSMRNACQHMWGYFRKTATIEEKEHYNELIQKAEYQNLLSFLQQTAIKYEVTYLQESTILQLPDRK